METLGTNFVDGKCLIMLPLYNLILNTIVAARGIFAYAHCVTGGLC